MANLSALRQRISTVETIKKTTHAMRLIAMSNHARLRADQARMRQYSADVSLVMQEGYERKKATGSMHVIIIVGSEKGLCGNFNTVLAEYCTRDIVKNYPDALYIGVGKKALEYLDSCSVKKIARYEPLTVSQWMDHVRALAQLLSEQYRDATTSIVHATSKSFFVRTVARHDFQALEYGDAGLPNKNSAHIEGDMRAVSEYAYVLSLTAFLLEHVLDSLVAEQAARFMSMDLATRNAEGLLETMRLDYNKLRQALITRELTDLASII